MYVYYNKRSHVRARDLKAYDVVLTTFPVLEREFPEILMDTAVDVVGYCRRRCWILP